MPESFDIAASTPVQEPPAAVRWQSWPLRHDPLHSLLVILALLAVGAAVRWLTGHTYLALIAAAPLLLASWRFFVPAEFELGESGIDQWILRWHRFIPWQAVRRHEIGADGVLLFPYEEHVAMASFRSLYLPWGSHREQVLAHVRRHLQPVEEAPEPGGTTGHAAAPLPKER
jgi:hypothetical protein